MSPQWRKLSARMLVVGPLGMLTRLLPLFALSLWLGSNRDNYWFETIIASVVVGASLWRWLVTRYRVGETHIEMRRGFFTREVLRVRRERIRSVNVESTLFHRLMRLSIVEIGTGQAESAKSSADRFILNAIAAHQVEGLRAELLAHTDQAEQHHNSLGEDIAHWHPSWARFAPMSWIGCGVLASLSFATWHMGDFHDRVRQSAVVDGYMSLTATFPWPLNWVGNGVGVFLAASVLATITYVMRFGKFSLSTTGPVLYVTNGLFKVQHRALDRARLRGVEIRKPLLLRLLGGARLRPIMTGTKNTGSGATILLPQAPRSEVIRVADIVHQHPYASTMKLRFHGRAAIWRRVTRGMIPAWFFIILFVLIRIDKGPEFDRWLIYVLPAIVLFFALLIIDRVRMLGHALLPGFLVTQHGSLEGKRQILQAEGIIGWNVTQSIFQRPLELVDVYAASAAGQGVYAILDIPQAEAWALVEALTPGVTQPWGYEVAGKSPTV